MDVVKLTPLEDIMDKVTIDGGEVRHSIYHDDGEIENVAINNLMAIGNRLAADICSNRFICQVLIPIDFAKRLVANARAKSLLPEYLPKDVYGGMTGIISQMSIYVYNGCDILVHVPQFDTTFRVKVGDHHQLVKKEDVFLKLGPNKGFDLILPYHPQFGYAPPQILLAWIKEGYESPKAVMEKFAALPTQEKLAQLSNWEQRGFIDSQVLSLETGMIKPEELKLLGEYCEDSGN